METLTVRFEPSASPQSELLRVLGRVVDALSTQGIISKAEVEAVFPGDEDSKYKGTFTVSFVGKAAPVKAAVSQLSGVSDAYIAPRRAAG